MGISWRGTPCKMPHMFERPVIVRTSTPGSEGETPCGKLPNVPQITNCGIGESYSAAQSEELPVESPLTAGPGIAINAPPCQRTSCPPVTANSILARCSDKVQVGPVGSKSAVYSSRSADATQVSLDRSGSKSTSIDSPISDEAKG